MLDKINKELGLNIKKSTFFYIVVLLFAIFFVVITNVFSTSERKTNSGDTPVEHIIKLFNDINDNYTLDIDVTIDEEKYNLEYSCDSNFKLYEGNALDKDGYLIYNDKVYEMSLNNQKLEKSDKEPSYFNNVYFDMNFLKKIINYCDFEYINPVKSTCKVKVSDYLKELNEYENKEFETNYDALINFDIVYYSDVLGKINVDYSKINSIITSSDNYLHYGIRIESINKNDYSNLLEYYKDDFE